VDPAYAVEPYLEEAERAGVRIVRVLETHTHADHVSGHGRLALEHGAAVSIHPLAEPAFPFDPVEDGEDVQVGSLAIRVLHTPGHRPEHCCYLVEGHLLTGDSLLIGDAARPDLAIEAREGAEGLYRSLQRLVDLPGDTEVDPGHTGASLCASGISSDRTSTVATERRTNHALAHSSQQEFVAASASISSPRPPTVERVVALNRGPFLGAPAPLEPLESVQGQLLDVRPAHAYSDGHAPGALNVPVDGPSFGTKSGFMLDAEQPISLHASSREQAALAAERLRAVGLLDVRGYLLDLETPERLDPIGLDELETLLAEDAVELLDVREKDERDEGYIPGSRNIPYRLLTMCCPDLPTERPVVTICESGARASIAASILRGRGYDARPVIEGGMAAWRERGGDTVVFRRCGSSS
jgi:glyoxylase-like metal-dependent hydrolase (beta-lactamase superfamily II)